MNFETLQSAVPSAFSGVLWNYRCAALTLPGTLCRRTHNGTAFGLFTRCEAAPVASTPGRRALLRLKPSRIFRRTVELLALRRADFFGYAVLAHA